MINDKKVYLQNYILNSSFTVDHINHNIYDCRKENLRESNKSKNMMNSLLSKRNTSGVKGVSYDKSRGKWIVTIKKDGVRYNLGRYDDFNKAVLVRFEKEIELFGEHSIYCNKNNGTYLLTYHYNNKTYSIKCINNIIEIEVLGNDDRGGIGSTGVN